MKHDLANKLTEYENTHDQGATSVLQHILFYFYVIHLILMSVKQFHF